MLQRNDEVLTCQPSKQRDGKDGVTWSQPRNPCLSVSQPRSQCSRASAPEPASERLPVCKATALQGSRSARLLHSKAPGHQGYLCKADALRGCRSARLPVSEAPSHQVCLLQGDRALTFIRTAPSTRGSAASRRCQSGRCFSRLAQTTSHGPGASLNRTCRHSR